MRCNYINKSCLVLTFLPLSIVYIVILLYADWCNHSHTSVVDMTSIKDILHNPVLNGKFNYTIYSSVLKRKLYGKRLEAPAYTHPILQQLDDKIVDSLENTNLKDFPIATSADVHHYEETLTALFSLQKVNLHLNHSVYFYDLGMTAAQAKQIQNAPFVIYRKFDFDKYPRHVRTLKTYAFKGDK